MSRKNRSRWMRGLAIVAGLVLAASGAATADLARVSFGAAGASFTPLANHGGMTLTISGAGYTETRQFRAGEAPSLTTYTRRGEPLADGVYKWELRAQPRAADLRSSDFANGRVSPDGASATQARHPRPQVQGGSFTIKDGAIVDPNMVEPESTREISGEAQISGDISASGTKNFAVVDPEDSDSSIYYAALEGPEAGTYYRGRARTVDGEVVIELPSYFAKVTEAEGLTVQLTAVGGWSRLFVAELSRARLTVRDADGGDVEFDFFVQGVRRGYADYQVERPAASPGR